MPRFSGKQIFDAVMKLGLEGIVSKREIAPYQSGPSRNWLKTKNYAEVELPILGVVQEAGKPNLALLGNKEDRTYFASASVVVNKLNRDLFWRAVAVLTDKGKKRAEQKHALAEARPGRTGAVSRGQQRAQTCHGHELLAGRRASLTAEGSEL